MNNGKENVSRIDILKWEEDADHLRCFQFYKYYQIRLSMQGVMSNSFKLCQTKQTQAESVCSQANE